MAKMMKIAHLTKRSLKGHISFHFIFFFFFHFIKFHFILLETIKPRLAKVMPGLFSKVKLENFFPFVFFFLDIHKRRIEQDGHQMKWNNWDFFPSTFFIANLSDIWLVFWKSWSPQSSIVPWKTDYIGMLKR